jgi:hypothetical protein
VGRSSPPVHDWGTMALTPEVEALAAEEQRDHQMDDVWDEVIYPYLAQYPLNAVFENTELWELVQGYPGFIKNAASTEQARIRKSMARAGYFRKKVRHPTRKDRKGNKEQLRVFVHEDTDHKDLDWAKQPITAKHTPGTVVSIHQPEWIKKTLTEMAKTEDRWEREHSWGNHLPQIRGTCPRLPECKTQGWTRMAAFNQIS